MSIQYLTDQDQGATFVLWDGVVTADEYLAHVRELLSDPDWPARRFLHLCDLQTTSLDASINEAVLKEAADLYGTHPMISRLKIAIIAGEAFVQAVAFESMLAQYHATTIVFNSPATAYTWLGVDPGKVTQALQSLRKK
ncbi:MAG TPA: hypothetical protein VHM28_11780 [Anaerolineales bacterium]|jgi:hypothetical protein|nr:hypothetical protein [Anaerolineales bacterium]